MTELESLHPKIYGVDGARPAVLMPQCPDTRLPPEEGACVYCPMQTCPGITGAWGNWHRHFVYNHQPHPSWFRVGENKPKEDHR